MCHLDNVIPSRVVWPFPAISVATPHLREDLLAPRHHTTEVAKAARTDLDRQREAFASLLQEMEPDDTRDHLDRRACPSRLAVAGMRHATRGFLTGPCSPKAW